MYLSKYFLPILKENPSEAQIASHRLMLRSGMIKQSSAGIYSWLPLGLKVLKKIENIVIEEQIAAGHIPIGINHSSQNTLMELSFQILRLPISEMVVA